MAASLPPLGARAQSDFPNRALKTVVPQPPGGGFDFVGRTLADGL
jgi:tripartite-type tricarboxylate transporter receptor subunit TctC